MANSDQEIAERFMKGEEVRRGLLRRTARGGGPWNGGAPSHGFSASEGTIRLGAFNDSSSLGGTVGSYLKSYEVWDVAVRLDDGMVILNGDNGPTATTRAHQREARDAAKKTGVKYAFLPFSALRAAGVHHVADIFVVATTPDRVIPRTVPAPSTDSGVRIVQNHFLGETLFRYRGRLYVSGLDRNDDPRRRNFYLARLPESSKAKTVDDALKALRPRALPEDVLRQGEWFLVPTDKHPKATDIVKDYSHKRNVWVPGQRSEGRFVKPYRGVPVVTASAEDFRLALSNTGRTWQELRERGRRHVATRVYLNGSVYVSGVLRDAEHGNLKLGDGKQWFKVVRNLADGSWGATGDVD